jgi:predicted aldo/keto reductase-like oxidoreductase
MVSPFCLGMTGGSTEVVQTAFDAGINFFFVSGDLHWMHYESLRLGLAQLLARSPSIREQIVVASCSYVSNVEFVSSTLYEVLESIPGLGYIDVLTVGGAYESDFLSRMHYAQKVRATGFVRSIAATLHDRGVAVTAHNHELIDAAFIRYNPVHPGARRDVFPLLNQTSSTLLYNFKSTVGCWEPSHYEKLGLSQEHWFPHPTDYYRFALSQPAIDGLLIGLLEPKQVAELDEAMQRGPLDDDEQQYLLDLVALDAGATLMPAPAPLET